MVFDVIFVAQHYFLYPQGEGGESPLPEEDSRALLGSAEAKGERGEVN